MSNKSPQVHDAPGQACLPRQFVLRRRQGTRPATLWAACPHAAGTEKHNSAGGKTGAGLGSDRFERSQSGDGQRSLGSAERLCSLSLMESPFRFAQALGP